MIIMNEICKAPDQNFLVKLSKSNLFSQISLNTQRKEHFQCSNFVLSELKGQKGSKNVHLWRVYLGVLALPMSDGTGMALHRNRACKVA